MVTIEEVRDTIQSAEKVWKRGAGSPEFLQEYSKMLKLLKEIEKSLLLYHG